MTKYKKNTNVFTSSIVVSASSIKAAFPVAVYERLGKPKKVEYIIEPNRIYVRVKQE